MLFDDMLSFWLNESQWTVKLIDFKRDVQPDTEVDDK